MIPKLIPVLGSQPAGDVSHKPGGRLSLLSARPAVTLTSLKRAATSFAAWWTESRWVWTVCLRQRRSCHLNSGPSAPESSTLTTRLRSHYNVCMYTGVAQARWRRRPGGGNTAWVGGGRGGAAQRVENAPTRTVIASLLLGQQCSRTGNESVPIQLTQCRFPGLAISSAKI